MSRADDLMREAHGLAEKIRRQRADRAGQRGREADGLGTMEARLAALWTDIRAARAAGTGPQAGMLPDRRTRPKWD